jgi:hypothetical protein
MALSWNPEDMLILCESATDVAALTDAGYVAMIAPTTEEFGPISRADHYVVAANGSSKRIANSLITAGLCKSWQISVNDLSGYDDLAQAAAEGGDDLVRSIIESSESVFADEVHSFAEVHKPENVPSYNTGWQFLNPYLRWSEAELGVFAGPYAGGKSALAQMLACDFADVAGRQIGATASICAWEDAAWRVKRNIERFAETREDLIPLKGPSWRKTDLLKRTFRITCRPGGQRSIDWYLERAEQLYHRENCRFFVFDPWNQHDEERDRGDTETQYVNKMLREMNEFTASHKCIMIVVTHISAKSYDDEGNIRPFRIAQAHGSSHFGKMADRGICVARTRALPSAAGEDRMIVRFDKAKDEETMGKIDTIAVKYDRDRMDIDVDDDATTELRELWRF